MSKPTICNTVVVVDVLRDIVSEIERYERSFQSLDDLPHRELGAMAFCRRLISDRIASMEREASRLSGGLVP